MAHKMYLVETKPSGYQEWYCPECGRRFLMQWPPNYEKIVLTPGDFNAVHIGSVGPEGLSLEVGLVTTVQDNPFKDWVENRSDLFDWED